MKPKASPETCLSCVRMKHLQITVEGFKYCKYCPFRRDYLKQIPFDDHPSNFTFREDKSMGIENYLHLWKSKKAECPTCGCTDFDVELEEFATEQIGIFKPVPTKRIVVICKSNPKHRYYPDSTMTMLPKELK